jgi:hypothetical protein
MWCVLDPPIHGVEATITVWPGLVDESTMIALSIRRRLLAPSHRLFTLQTATSIWTTEDGTDSAQAVTQIGEKSWSSHDVGSNELLSLFPLNVSRLNWKRSRCSTPQMKKPWNLGSTTPERFADATASSEFSVLSRTLTVDIELTGHHPRE